MVIKKTSNIYILNRRQREFINVNDNAQLFSNNVTQLTVGIINGKNNIQLQ